MVDVGDARWSNQFLEKHSLQILKSPREVKKRQRVSESMKFLLAQEGEGRKLLWKMRIAILNIQYSIPYVCACLFLGIQIQKSYKSSDYFACWLE